MNRLITGYGTRLPAVAVLACALVGSAACGKAVRESRSSSYLIVENLLAASGAEPGKFSNVLASDVVTVVSQPGGDIATCYEDTGQVQLRIAMKDPGTPGAPTAPTTTNEITISRYHVAYVRADGRNTPGVDVPDAFDGAVTGTVTEGGTTLSFVLVRVQAKLQAPLVGLAGGGGVISTIADVTLYGRDQAGNDVSVLARISVNFADWGDPR